MSGSEMQREKEKVAAKMREKQAAGKSLRNAFALSGLLLIIFPADAKKAGEGAGAAKK